MSYKSGFCGHDSMREKAIKEFGSQMRGLNLNTPESNSSKARTNMRLYKKGGKVHGLTSMQVDLHIPTRAKQHHQKATRFEKVAHKADGGMMGQPDDLNSRIQTANQLLGNAAQSEIGLKRGGKAHHKAHRTHKADGGMMGLSQMGRRDLEAGRSALGLKHGGQAHRKHKFEGGPMREEGRVNNVMKRGGKTHRVHKFDGGSLGGSLVESLLSPVTVLGKAFGGLKRGGTPHRVRKFDGGSLGGSLVESLLSPVTVLGKAFGGLKHGGKVHRKHKSEGGPLRGEHPGTRASSNNYESNMRGEHRAHHKADGGKIGAYAAGGVGKVRHGQMTMGGKPILPRHKIKHG